MLNQSVNKKKEVDRHAPDLSHLKYNESGIKQVGETDNPDPYVIKASIGNAAPTHRPLPYPWRYPAAHLGATRLFKHARAPAGVIVQSDAEGDAHAR